MNGSQDVDELQGDAVPEPSQADTAYRRLEEMIVTLALAPGSNVTEGALIEMTGLGRTPVREAVQRLAWEGFFAIRPRAGLRIAPMVQGDWMKIIDARRGVEALLARSAASNVTIAAAREFAAAASAMQSAVESGDVAAFLVADKLFDTALGRAADNDYAVRLAAPLQTHSRRYWFANTTSGSLAEAAEHHLDLITAILGEDPDMAEAEARRLMALLADMAMHAG